MKAKIYSVKSASFHINKSNPPQLEIVAVGEVNSTGWSDGQLTPWVYVVPPKDGIQDFDFVASAPRGIVLWVITPIVGYGTFELDSWVKGFRIHTSSSSITVMLEDDKCLVDSISVSELGIPKLI